MWRKLRLYSRVSGELSKVPPCVTIKLRVVDVC